MIMDRVSKVIPNSVKEWASNPRTADFVENTFVAVSVETAMKAVGRPMFIMSDKEADSKEKKKYAATKELLYQVLCLGLYLGALPTIKKYLYNKISGHLSKDSKWTQDIKAFNDAKHIVEDAKKEYKKAGSFSERLLSTLRIKKNETIKAAKAKWTEADKAMRHSIISNPKLKFGKGVSEFSAIIGSILMLTVVAPQISHFIIHPVMNALGFDKHKEAKPKV